MEPSTRPHSEDNRDTAPCPVRILREHLGWIAGVLLVAMTSTPATGQPTVFELLREAPFVVVGQVAARTSQARDRLLVYRLDATSWLRGEIPGTPPPIAQELVFRTDRPLLGEGQHAILLLEPDSLPSRYRSQLDVRSVLRILGGASGILPVDHRSLVSRYLAALEKPGDAGIRERVRIWIQALSNERLATDALRELSAQEDLAQYLSDVDRARLQTMLLDANQPAALRRGLLDLVARQDLRSLVPALRRLLDEQALAVHARRALAALGHPITAGDVRSDLASELPERRKVALAAASALPPDERAPILLDVALTDPDPEVRVRAVELMRPLGDAAVPLLATVLDEADPRVAYYATQGLADVGSEAAVAELGRQARTARYDTQVAAIFALARVGSPATLETLREIRSDPSRPRLARVVDVALGAPAIHE